MIYDCIVIGGGIIGCATLDRLSRYNLKCLLLEKGDDVASFSSKANSGIVHAGYDCEPNTLKAKFNVLGNKLIFKDAEELDVPYLKCGSLVVAREDQFDQLKVLENKAILNGVDVKILNREETLKIEKNVTDSICYSLFAKDAGVITPYQLCIGYADRSILNGSEIKLDSAVIGISKEDNIFTVKTDNSQYQCKVLINCAGENGALINDYIGAEHYETLFRRGDYFVLDNTERKNISTVLFPLPTAQGKGILVAPTADGNVLYGPTAIDTVQDDTSSSIESLEEIKRQVPLSYKCPAFNKCIRVYSGLRTIIGKDFLVQKSEIIDNYIFACGICSPGLSSAPAIAEELLKYVLSILNPTLKSSFVTKMERKKKLMKLSSDELNKLIEDNPSWGRIVCRCEKVCEAEIVNAIHSPLTARTVDAVKRRTRAGMGRCQGGFCGERVIDIISRELNIPFDQVKKGNGMDSSIAKYKI